MWSASIYRRLTPWCLQADVFAVIPVPNFYPSHHLTQESFMALVKKPVTSNSSSAAADTGGGGGRASASAARDAEVQRKRARTLAKQQ